MSEAGPVRRTQEERSSATRAAILDAAIRCLIERGYAATSTAAIQELADVSRGALTHQFPSKQTLMIAAIHHLAENRVRAMPATPVDAPNDEARLRWVLGKIWDVYDSDLFDAALELWSASRTDPILREALEQSEPALGRKHRELLAPAFGELASHPNFRRAYEAVARQMRGAVLTNLIRKRPIPSGAFVTECAGIFRSALEDNQFDR